MGLAGTLSLPFLVSLTCASRSARHSFSAAPVNRLCATSLPSCSRDEWLQLIHELLEAWRRAFAEAMEYRRNEEMSAEFRRVERGRSIGDEEFRREPLERVTTRKYPVGDEYRRVEDNL
jgi:hypothetical protein